MSDENNNDIDTDFENLEFDDADPFEDFETGAEGGLGELIRNNPIAKVGIVLGGLAIIFLGVTLFGGDEEEQVRVSMATGAARVKQAPGEEVSEAYRQQIEEVNEQMVEEAVQERQSAMPIPTVTAEEDRVQVQNFQAQEEDPLERWRRIQEERQKREQIRQQELAQAPTAPTQGQGSADGQRPTSEMIEQMATAMASQMQTILETLDPQPASYSRIAPPDFLEQQREAERADAQAQAQQTAQNGEDVFGGRTGLQDGQTEPEVVDILIPAGEIEYAQLMLEANSDVPGPILALLASGPLSGARMLGTFETAEKHLILRFSTVVVDGVSQQIDAVAIDPSTTSTGMVTDINNRYFQRVVLPAAAAFVEGLGEAISESGTTTVTVDDGSAVEESEDLDTEQEIFAAIEDAASEVSAVIDEEAGRARRMIKVAAGTPMGILFLQPVLEEQGR